MNSYFLLCAIGMSVFILLMLFIKLGSKDNEGSPHYLLQILIFGFILISLVIIGKVAVDNRDVCSWNVVNSTTEGNSTIYSTNYVYDYECEADTTNTTDLFYRSIMWFVRVSGLYIFLYFIYEVLSYFGLFSKRGE